MSVRPFDPTLDLVLERVVAVPADRVWRAWTEPELLKKWFCPLPWKTVECEIDLQAGGIFRTVMQGPNGESQDSSGCFLEVVPGKRLIWTDALSPGFRPATGGFMTGIIELFPEGNGTRYKATALHASVEVRQQHETMGFHAGWGAALDQLVALVGDK